MSYSAEKRGAAKELERLAKEIQQAEERLKELKEEQWKWQELYADAWYASRDEVRRGDDEYI